MKYFKLGLMTSALLFSATEGSGAEPTQAAAEPKVNKSIVKDRTKYVGGNNGDEVALALKEATNTDGKADDAKISAIGKQNGIETVKGTNVGMRRMNLGNQLRGKHNKGLVVHIGDKEIPGKVKEPAAATA